MIAEARLKKVGDAAGTCNPSPPLWSWYCCAHAPKGCHLAVVLLSWALFTLLFCMPCLVRSQFISRQNNVQEYLELHACGDHIKSRANPALDSFVSDTNEKQGEYNDIQHLCSKGKHICSDSQSLCFPCTMVGIKAENENNERYSNEDATRNIGKRLKLGQVMDLDEKMVQEQVKFTKNLTFRLIDGRTTVSCFPSPPYHLNKSTSIKMENLEQIEPAPYERSSSPNVAINPSLMEWGPKPLFSPSVSFLTVLNTCNDTVLHVFKPFSTNSQFYAYGFEEMIIAPQEMVSIAFVFLPRMLGLATGHLVLQTSLGGFLVQVQGEGVESPYRVQPFTGVNAFSRTRLRDNMTLYNPSDGSLFVEEISAWIAKSEDTSTQPAGAVCKTDVAFGVDNQNLLSDEDPWFGFGIDVTGIQLLGIRPSGGWEISPHCSSAVVELDISTHMEGKLSGDLCIIFKNTLQDTTQTVIVPLEADIMKNPGNDLPIQPLLNFIKSDIVSKGEQTIKVALSLDNDGSEIVRLEEICESSGGAKLLEIELFQGLILLPGTATHVATITYKIIEKTSPYDYEVQQSSLFLDCRLLVVTNSTRGPQLEIPCQDLIYDHDSLEENNVPIEVISDSIHGIYSKVNSQREPLNLQNRFSYTVSQPALKDKSLEFVSESNELFLKDWKSQGASENLSVLVQSEIMYSMIQIGTEGSKWVNVSNPSEQPVVMQLILSSESVAAQCKEDGEVWENWEPNHPYPTANKLTTKTTDDSGPHYTNVFFLPEYGVTEAKVHPYGKASFGPIFFRPSKRCVWTSSVFIKNNLSGVEWLPLQGAGGSVDLTFLEGSQPIQALHFNVQKPSIPPSTIGAMKFYSNHFFHRAGMKVCNKSLQKAFLAKNTGDMPLAVNTIEVAGKTCGSDGFRVHTCDRFSLVPGQSIELLVSYQSDFSASVVYRDLELAMSSGILVIPMQASLPDYMVILCQKSFIWLVLWKTILVICLVVVLFALVFCRLLAQETASVDPSQWRQGQKFTITEYVKGVTQGGHLKQSLAEVSNTKLNFPAVKNKSPGEQQMSSTVKKVGEPIWEGNGSSNIHDSVERNNNPISQSEYEHRKSLCDAETKALINADVGRDQSRDDSLCSQNSDAGNFFFPSAVAQSVDFTAESNASNRKCGIYHSQCKQTKWIHDNSNKILSNSGLGGNKSLDITGSSEALDAGVSFSKNKVPEPLNPMGESNPPAVSSNSSSHVIPYSGNSLTVKLEKEKGKRRKKRSGAMTMKQDVTSSQSGNSTPSSPASPITPVASSRPVSPLVKMQSQSNLMLSTSVGANDFQHIESAGCGYTSNEFPRTQGKGDDISQTGFGADVCKIQSCEVGVGVIQTKRWDATGTFSKANFKQKNEGESTDTNGDWVTVAKKSASGFNNSKGIRPHKSEFNSSTRMARSQLTTSATFPRGRYQESKLGYPIVIGMKQTMVPSTPNPSLVSTSAIAPHARAPGTKLNKSNSVKDGQGASLKSKLIQQDFTYDIWGNHFANFPLQSDANASAATTELPNMLSSCQGYSSFFTGFSPQAHLEKASMSSSSSNHSDSVCVFPSD